MIAQCSLRTPRRPLNFARLLVAGLCWLLVAPTVVASDLGTGPAEGPPALSASLPPSSPRQADPLGTAVDAEQDFAERAVLETSEPEVQWSPAGATDWQDAPPRHAVRVGDRVRSGPSSAARLIFSDGRVAELGPGTGLLLQRLEAGPSGRVTLFQTSGTSLLRVPPTGETAGLTEIETPAATVSMHGTAPTADAVVAVQVALDGRTRVTNLGDAPGSLVRIRAQDPPGAEVPLLPGQEMEVIAGLASGPLVRPGEPSGWAATMPWLPAGVPGSVVPSPPAPLGPQWATGPVAQRVTAPAQAPTGAPDPATRAAAAAVRQAGPSAVPGAISTPALGSVSAPNIAAVSAGSTAALAPDARRTQAQVSVTGPGADAAPLQVVGPAQPKESATPLPGPSPAPGPSLAPIQVSPPVAPGLSPPVRAIPPSRAPGPPQEITVPRGDPLPEPDVQAPPGQPGADPVRQGTVGAAPAPAPIRSFDGISNQDQGAAINITYNPPDDNGDVGPNHYVQAVNVSFAVYDKAGRRLVGPLALNSLFRGRGTLCETTNRGDPVVVYDHQADRWIITYFAFDKDNAGNNVGPFYQCIAVSQTADPTGQFYAYPFLISATTFNDYGKMGVWPDAYYMSFNIFPNGATQSSQGGVAAFERARMLVGETARQIYLELPSHFGLLPAHWNGATPPPAGTPNYYVAHADPNILRVFEFRVDWNNTANSTFTNPQTLTTANVDSRFTCGRDCIPQPGTTQRLDALGGAFTMYRLQYRNFGTHQTLVLNHTVDVDGTNHAGIRWYELRKATGGWTIRQQSTYGPDADHRWVGSIAMDGVGNIALGFSVASANLFPSIRYVGRLASDPLSTLPQSETTLQAGGGSVTNGNRWGDYTSLSVDPTDDCTFWYTNQYHPSTGGAFSNPGWHTRIGAFRFPNCGGAPARPANDNFGAATVVTAVPAEFSVNTGNATTEPGEPTSFACGGANVTVGNTVWYRFTPGTARTVTLSTTRSNFDTVLAVYTGSALGALTRVACNDDAGGTRQSSVQVQLSAGTTYFIQVGGYNSDSGDLVLAFSAPPVTCAPRPNVGVFTARTGDGRLQVTITATGAGNELRSVDFRTEANTANNALVDAPAPAQPVLAAAAPPASITLPANTGSYTFFVRRPTGGSSTTLPLTVRDACGDWPTFVGGGPQAF